MKTKYSTFIMIFILYLFMQTCFADLSQSSNIKITTDKGTIDLKSLNGKVVYLDFWASWCGPCRKSFPWMNKVQQEYAKHGLVVLAVNVDSNPLLANKFLNANPASFSIAYDSEGKLASSLEIKAMPSSFIIKSDGTLFKKHLGFKSKHIAEYEISIRNALGLQQISSRSEE